MNQILALQAAPGGIEQMLPTIFMFGSIIVIFYFMILRPQKKRQDDQKKLIDNLKKGDKIVLSSGILCTFQEMQNNAAVVQIADNVRIRVEKGTIVGLEGSTSSTQTK